MSGQKITVEILRKMVIGANINLGNNKEEINKLNVFPVPDGDTGTNMYLTFNSAVKELESDVTDSVGSMAKLFSKACINGARGNSGVILSQLVRGFTLGVEGLEILDGQTLAMGLQSGVNTAYKGVMKPVEGTILTVAREAAKAAEQKAKQGGSFIEVMEAVVEGGNEALAKTTEMLPILKQVGVVDAGGKGLMAIYEGALKVLRGEQLEAQVTQNSQVEKLVEDEEYFKVEDIEFAYCTEFKVKGSNLNEGSVRGALKDFGDSLLVIADTDVAKIHIHTNNPGQVLQVGLEYGELIDIKIDNMIEQCRKRMDALIKPNVDKIELPSSTNQKEIGIVAVASGRGLVDILRSTGVDVVVEGGQTNNPSTEEISKAVNAVPAKKVIILPNNKNIIMAAEQVAQVVEKEIAVVPSRSIPQGVASLLAFNPNAEFEANKRVMTDILAGVVAGEITYAVRETKIGEQEINEGNILGLVDGKIVSVGEQINDTLLEVLRNIEVEEKELLTLFYGSDVSEADANQLKAEIEREFDWLEVEVYSGQQPLYYYLFSLE